MSWGSRNPAYAIRSDKDTHFSGALAQNAKEDENISIPFSRGWITGIRVTSDENLAWEIQVFRTDGFDDANYDLDSFGGGYAFAAADGKQVAGAGPYYYAVDGLGMYYVDKDVNAIAAGELHIRLVNRSAAAKTAGSNGEAVVEVDFVPA